MAKTITLAVRLDPVERAALERAALADQRSMSALARKIINKEMRSSDKPQSAMTFDRHHYLEQAKSDAQEAIVAIEAGDWLRADICLKLAIDEISDAGVLCGRTANEQI